MGQIISALFRFFLEIGKSGDRYKTRRNKSQAIIIVVLVLAITSMYGMYKGFGSAYISKVEVVRIKKRLDVLEAENKVLFTENTKLQIRNEILSRTLSMYIGKSLVLKINQDKDLDETGLPDLDVEAAAPAKPPIKKTP